MTDNEIIKALEKHYKEVEKGYSDHLAYGGEGDEHEEKYIYMLEDALDLINRQQAEIKEWKRVVETWVMQHEKDKAEIERLQKKNNQFADIGKMYSEIKAEAVKEFVKAYKDQIKNYTGMFTDEGFYVSLDAVLSAVDFVLNKTLEEMVEENNG